MISDDDDAEISKSSIKTEIDIKSKNNLQWKKKIIKKPYKKLITKQNLQVALDFAFNDVETVDYSNDTRIDVLDDLKPVDYNNDTSITDIVPIKKLETPRKRMMKKRMAYKLTVNYVNLSDDDDDVKFIKKNSLAS